MSDLGVARGRIEISTEGVRRAQQEVSSASQTMNQALGAIGISLTAAGFVQLAKAAATFAVQSSAIATAYTRQGVAARNLAGGQAQLNELLDVYNAATGGAIDNATALADVTRLLAVGFADSTAELDEFARAARGIAIATGQSQDYIISQLQLAIANQSTLRLDQLGLGVSEVKQRIDELKASNRGLTDEMAYQQAILEAANDKFGDLINSTEGAASGAERLRKEWADMRLELGQEIKPNVDEASNDLVRLLNLIRQVRDAHGDLTNQAISRRAREEGRPDPFGPIASRTSIGRTRPEAFGTGGATGPAIDMRARDEAIVEWAQGVREIERQANEQRLDATRQYEEQRSSTIREYGKTIAREAEDFARSRARAEADFARAVAGVREAAARREVRMAEDLARTVAQARADSAERLADMQEQFDRTVAQRRADSAERIAGWEEDRAEAMAERRRDSTARLLELEEDFTRERERAMRDHRDRLHSAAAQFDAFAIAQEQRRFAREQEERREAHDEQLTTEQEKLAEAVAQLDEAHRERLEDERRALDKSISQAQDAYNRQVADEKEALDKRISQAQEAYERQLEDAREADALRLEDMAADFAERKRREDEDRRTRLTRMAVDHNDQLNEMARQHGLRLTQISEHAADERRQLDDEFQKELDALGIRTDAWAEKQKQITDYAIKEFDRWWERISAIANGLAGIGPQPLNPFIAPPGQFPSLTGGGTTNTTTVGGATVNINIYPTASQSPQEIGTAAINEYIKRLGPGYTQ